MRNIPLLITPALIISFLLPLAGCDSGEPEALGGPVAMRRLTAEQYQNAIQDTFGKKVEVAGRFEPDSRRSGLNAVGTSRVSVTPSGLEQYEAMARNIAAQVTSAKLHDQVLPCKPESVKEADEACAEMVVRNLGRLLLRRPLSDEEIKPRVDVAGEVATASTNFYKGLEVALGSLLVAPDFLFRVEVAEPAPTKEQPGRLLLSNLSLASRLSYFLWNRGPDEALLAAAERGELTEREGLERQVDRLLASEHLSSGVRAFFDDLFLFDQFENISKDVARYPLYNKNVANATREQTLRFVVDQLVARQSDYRTLFTARELPMTRSLGPLYGVPVRVTEGWEDTQLPAKQPRAGLLSHASFSLLHSHPGRSSPTLRGVFVREALLCQTIPEAPSDVDFTQFSDDKQEIHKTARERLAVHATQASCDKCHRLTDPIGLGLEVFDGIGRYRTTENDAPIDTSSEFDGQKFDDPVELGAALAQSPLIGACLVENMYRYAVGRKQTNRERKLLRHLEGQFDELDYQVPGLMREIVMSEGFRTASAPKKATAELSPPRAEESALVIAPTADSVKEES